MRLGDKSLRKTPYYLLVEPAQAGRGGSGAPPRARDGTPALLDEFTLKKLEEELRIMKEQRGQRQAKAVHALEARLEGGRFLGASLLGERKTFRREKDRSVKDEQQPSAHAQLARNRDEPREGGAGMQIEGLEVTDEDEAVRKCLRFLDERFMPPPTEHTEDDEAKAAKAAQEAEGKTAEGPRPFLAHWQQAAYVYSQRVRLDEFANRLLAAVHCNDSPYSHPQHRLRFLAMWLSDERMWKSLHTVHDGYSKESGLRSALQPPYAAYFSPRPLSCVRCRG